MVMPGTRWKVLARYTALRLICPIFCISLVRFTAMMLAKVISVQLVSMLGYDLLFSDVDIVWFNDPLEYFNGPNSPVKQHDLIFQDDGSRTLRYAPVNGTV